MKQLDFYTSLYGRLVYLTLVIFCCFNFAFLIIAFLERVRYFNSLAVIFLSIAILNLFLFVYVLFFLLKISPRFVINKQTIVITHWFVKKIIRVNQIDRFELLSVNTFHRPFAMDMARLTYRDYASGELKKLFLDVTGLKPDKYVLIGEISKQMHLIK